MARPVVIYLEDAPRRTGSGAHLRFFSNVRGWCDTGAPVHLVRLTREGDAPWDGDPDLPLASVHIIKLPGSWRSSSLAGRVAFRLGLITRGAVQYYYPIAPVVANALQQMSTIYPAALHVMEGESIAGGALHARAAWVWSEHESPSDTVEKTHSASQGAGEMLRRTAAARESRFKRAFQRSLYRRASGIVYINESASRSLQGRRFGRPSAYVPLSVADDAQVWTHPATDPSSPLRVLHLGSIAHLPSYLSLRFILGEVFPLLTASTLARFRLTVVGRAPSESARAREIIDLARAYPNVDFIGFVPCLRSVYKAHDVQIVAGSHEAGIRTRIIESLARGLPVMATTSAVSGSAGLVPERHFILLGSATESAARIEALLENRESLSAVADAGRRLYENVYSRSAVRDVLLSNFGTLLSADQKSDKSVLAATANFQED